MRLKIMFLLLFLGLVQVSASTFAQKITIASKDIRIEDALQKVELQSGYRILYNAKTLSNIKPIAINVKNVSVEEALRAVFEGQQVTYVIDNKTIVIKEKEKSVLDYLSNYMAAINIKGKVMDENGKPLSGAYVRIESVPVSYVTGKDGNFYFRNVPENASMIVSYVGYKTDTIAINGRTDFLITLALQLNNIKEVAIVSTGYQNLSKERATGAFSKPDMQLFQNRVGNMDIVSRMEGLVPGLVVVAGPKGIIANNRLGNGNTTQKSIIRGQSTINGLSDPLYVVNGVPVDNINLVNPDDIADITVLKDAAASAIWGARAANGVIVIVTKSGKKGGKLSVSYNGSVNFSGKPDFGYGKVMSSAQYIQTAREIFNPVQFPYSGLADTYLAPHEQILYSQFAKNGNTTLDAGAVKSLDSLSSINNMDQVKELWYRNALSTNHTFSVSGGSPIYSFYTSFGYSNSTSSQIGQSSNNYRFNFNQEYNPIKRLKVSLATSFGNNVSKSARPIDISNQFFPYQLFLDQNGSSISMPYVQGLTPERRASFQQGSKIDLNYNPLDEIDYGHSSSSNLYLNLTGEVDLKLIKGLSFHGTYGYQKAPGVNKSYDDSKSFRLRKELLSMTSLVNNLPVYNLPVDGGTFVVANNEERSWTLRNQLIYSAALRAGKDQLNVQFGQEAREQFSTGNGTTVRGYNEELQTYPALDYYRLSVTGVSPAFPGGRPTTISGSNFSIMESLNRFTSYFALMNYTLNGKYSIDGSWRVDHSNLFGSDVSAQNRPAWSLGGKWNIKKEAFMSSVSWLDNLGLRATYGITGSTPYNGAASQWDILSLGGGFSTPYAGAGMFISSAANTKLGWEITQTTNLGIDFSMLGSRLSGSIDLYRKKTTDMIGSVPLNPFTSFANATGNIGNLSNKGIELSLRSVNIRMKDFEWSTLLNFAYNKNELVSYSERSAASNTVSSKLSSFYWIGYPAQTLFAYQYAGLDNTGSPMIKLADGTVTKAKGVAKPDDLMFMGTTLPVYSGGFSNSFRYQSLTLSANIIFNLGHVMRRDVNTFYSGRIPFTPGSFGGNLNSYFLDRWKVPGDESRTNIPGYLAAEPLGANGRDVSYYTQGDVNVISASYLKLRDVTLSYGLPSRFLEKIRVKQASFFVQTTNFMMWKANKADIDPEFNDPRTGARMIPGSHSFNIGTNITF